MATIFSESFETDGNGTRYTTQVAEFSDGSSDFFTRTDGSNITSSYSVTGADGSFFFAAQDVDSDQPLDELTLDFTGIDITGFTNLAFSALFAEDNSSDGNEDYDNGNLSDTNFVKVEYQIDGGGFMDILDIRSVLPLGTSNGEPAVDTDGDGVGDGTTITDTFQSLGGALTGTGSSLDLRFTMNLEDGDEDIAIDLIEISGDGAATDPIELYTDNTFTTLLGSFTLMADALAAAADGNGILVVDPAALTNNLGQTVANTNLTIRADAPYEETYTVATSNDVVFEGTAVVTALGNGGDNAITGGDSADSLDGGAGVDAILGGTGDDTIKGGFGDDSLLSGEDGADKILGDGGNDTIDAGADNDFAIGNDGQDSIDGGTGDDTLNGGKGNDTVNGEDGNDSINGANGRDLIDGGIGNDTINGQAQEDTILGGDGDDMITGGDAADSLEGGNGADTIDGGAFNDIINGGADADLLLGGNARDTIDGGSGADIIDGGVGWDQLTGGSELDIFVFDTNWGKDTITDFDANGEVMDLSATGLTFADLTISQDGANVLIEQTALPRNSITLENEAVADITEADFNFGLLTIA